LNFSIFEQDTQRNSKREPDRKYQFTVKPQKAKIMTISEAKAIIEKVLFSTVDPMDKPITKEQRAIAQAWHVLNPQKDLFDHWTEQPPTLRAIVDTFADIEENQGLDHDQCRDFLSLVEKIGYTFDFGLDCSPQYLRKI
jgi:hypothetical protein